MKLYAWQPKGYGEQSFFVMSESEEKAKKVVADFIKENPKMVDGWGFLTDYYELTVLEANQVIVNNND